MLIHHLVAYHLLESVLVDPVTYQVVGPVARSSVQYSMRFVSDSRATIGTFSQEDLQRALQSVAILLVKEQLLVVCLFVVLFNYRRLNHFPHHPDTLIDQVDTNDTKLRSVCIESSNNS